MSFNRLREMLQPGERNDDDMGFTQGARQFARIEPTPEDDDAEFEGGGEYSSASRGPSPGLSENGGGQILLLTERCLELVAQDPELAHRGKPLEWEDWFAHPLLRQVRNARMATGLKQRFLAFMALMLPFLEAREQEQIRAMISDITPSGPPGPGESMVEQDLIHTQWLVQAILKSRDIPAQMKGLRRSIVRQAGVEKVA